jgi:mRNA deadenylase 3'-5' endonuclease subunit Ccr4
MTFQQQQQQQVPHPVSMQPRGQLWDSRSFKVVSYNLLADKYIHGG